VFLLIEGIHGTNLAIVPMTFALTHGDVTVRLLRQRDAKKLETLILGNREWLRPWEATNPFGPNSFDIKAMVKGLIRQLDNKSGLPCVIELGGEVVGQLNVANILFGSVSSAVIGYWVIPEVAGRGVTPSAVALATDYLFNVVGLHRVEIDIRPENVASLRVVEKLGFRFEGLKERFIHINGAWRDHYVFALTHEEVIGGVLNRWIKGETPRHTYPWSNETQNRIKHTELNADELGS
jgi:ribosomal-protein-alanine N-acetyltransferase